MYSLFKKEQEKSLIDRQCYKKFDGFGLRVLLMGREKIERKTTREKKMDFHFEGNTRRETTSTQIKKNL